MKVNLSEKLAGFLRSPVQRLEAVWFRLGAVFCVVLFLALVGTRVWAQLSQSDESRAPATKLTHVAFPRASGILSPRMASPVSGQTKAANAKSREGDVQAPADSLQSRAGSAQPPALGLPVNVDSARTPKGDVQAPALNPEAASGQVRSADSQEKAGKLTSLDDGSPTISFSREGDVDEHKLKIAFGAPVVINEGQASISDLKPGDEVKVMKNKAGQVTAISARRAEPGIVLSSTPESIAITPDFVKKNVFGISGATGFSLNGKPCTSSDLKIGDDVVVVPDREGTALEVELKRTNLFSKFWTNFTKNLFKPLLLFFYMGFAVPLLRIGLEFPKAIYQGLTIYLLISIGWHGGEELAVLNPEAFRQAMAFLCVGFGTNFVIGAAAYLILRFMVPRLRKVDAATVAAYYGSDSAGTFVTCLGVLEGAHIAYAAYMPVMLAVMEIPGCLVGLYLVSRLRKKGMDSRGNMPGERGYHAPAEGEKIKSHSISKVLREVFLNPGLFLLFGGILVGFISRLQGVKVVEADDKLFVSLFQGLLCLFLLEMGMTASKRLRDLRRASSRFIAFGLIAPNIFAVTGLCVAQCLSHFLHQPFQLGTYVLFAVLCAAASYIAVPAIQRIAIPEASPSLPLAASLGLTFSYNVTIGIPIYLLIAQQLMRAFPVS